MNSIEPEKREIIKALRLTTEEWERIQSDMSSHDYLSFTKYARALLLEHRITIQKVKITDRSIRNQINESSKKLSKIGSNYNQVVKKFNTLANSKKKNGDPVINTKAMAFYMNKLEAMMKEVIQTQKTILEQVNQIHVNQD